MKTKKSIKSRRDADGDREARLRGILGASGSAEEALLKRCAHYDLEDNAKSASAACDAVVALREEQRVACVSELHVKVAIAAVRFAALKKVTTCFLVFQHNHITMHLLHCRHAILLTNTILRSIRKEQRVACVAELHAKVAVAAVRFAALKNVTTFVSK